MVLLLKIPDAVMFGLDFFPARSLKPFVFVSKGFFEQSEPLSLLLLLSHELAHLRQSAFMPRQQAEREAELAAVREALSVGYSFNEVVNAVIDDRLRFKFGVGVEAFKRMGRDASRNGTKQRRGMDTQRAPVTRCYRWA